MPRFDAFASTGLVTDAQSSHDRSAHDLNAHDLNAHDLNKEQRH
jgi:hypothetical protein